jgi:lipopolysaccharide assembly outer membrane protein LptD (OstA)
LIIFLNCLNVFSQVDESDTLDVTDSLEYVIDTTRQVESDIDAVINYSANDSVVFDLKENKMFLFDQSELTYKDLKLNAGIIVVDQETEILEAFGIPDSNQSGKYVQVPLMYQGNEEYEGVKLTYNFKTQQGNISMGFTEADVGYYFGEKIKKVTPEVYFIKNGLYTTSTDRIDPEYYFFSPKMKIIPKDKVIAKSVFLYIEGVPVFWIPLAVFPNKSGRSSGIIMPTYGDDATYGKYFSKFGYFWAINDFVDLAVTGSWFSKGRVDLYSGFRYVLKYNFNGSVNGGYSRIRLGEEGDDDRQVSDEWAINFEHNQQINPTTSVVGNLEFVSGKSYYNNSTNQLSELLRQNVVSNFYLTKYWEATPYSLTINYYRDQNLENGDVTERIPSVNFTSSESFPFKSDYSSTDDLKFYEYLSYSYAGNFRYDRTRRTVTGYTGLDSTYKDRRLGAQNNVRVNFSPKFDFFNIIPFFDYTERWYTKSITKTFNPLDSSVNAEDVDGFKAVRVFNTGVSFNTKFIGIFTPKIFNVTGIRHTITPTITYNYQPDFSSEKYGYYGSYVDASGNTVKYSFFEKEIFGGAPFGETQSLSFNLANLFEMKTRINDTTENRFQLFNFDGGINYNFAADSLKLSELITNFRTQIGNILNIGGSARFNFYKYDEGKNTRVNKFLWNEERRIADLTSFNINLSTSYNFGLSNEKGISNETSESEDTLKVRKNEKKKSNEVKFNIPISGSLNYNYSETRTNPSVINKSSNISGSIAFSPTENWKFTFRTNYDLVNKEISAPYVTAYRDLNSWEMSFNWYPTGTYRGFRLEIRIKAPDLHDIKITKEKDDRGAFGDFGF